MELNIKRIVKKFNLNIIDETIKNDEYLIDEFTGINSLRSRNAKNVGVVISKNTDLTTELEKINLIVLAEINSLNKSDIEKISKYNKPVLYSKYTKRELISILDSYMLKKQAKPNRIHATMLSIFGEGVLITGKSGIGKSELALELINRKHLFIGDDAIDIISFAGQPMAKAPKMSRDFIEVRGVGIINVKGMFGIQTMIKEHKVDLIIELVNLDDVKSSVERLGKEYVYKVISGVEIPLIQIPVSSGRSVAPVVESATIAFKQRMYDDYIAANDLTDRLKK